MSKQPPPAPTASTIGPCPTVIQIVGPTTLKRDSGPEELYCGQRRRRTGFASMQTWMQSQIWAFVVMLLSNVHGKHLWSCWDGQLINHTIPGQTKFSCGWSGGAKVLGNL